MKGTRISTFALACLAAGGLVSAQTAAPAPGETLSQSYRGSQARNVEYQKIAPFKIMDNVYYVGPGSVAVYLVTTSAGLILIDSAQEPYVDFILDNVRKVGFDPKNIKYVLLTHGHLDHFGGASKIKALSGARIALTETDWNFMANNQANAIRNGRGPKPGDEAPAKDMVIKEGDTITLGDTRVKVYMLPGHTPGSPSYEFTAFDKGKGYKAFVFGGPGPRNGVEGGTEFLKSIERLEKDHADVQVALNVHSWLTSYPYPNGALLERRDMKARNPNGPNPFIDNASWRQWLKQAHEGAVKYIADEKAKAQKGQTN